MSEEHNEIVDMETGEVISDDTELVLAPQKGGQLINNIDDLGRLGKMLSMSGYFADAKSAAQCGVKMLTAIELGMPIMSAMNGIHIIKGKPAYSGNLIASRIKASGKYNYKVVEHTDQVCTIDFYEKWGKNWERSGSFSFSIEDAKRAGLSGDNWKKYPKNMLFNRCISSGYKFYCPDVFITSVYVEEELTDIEE